MTIENDIRLHIEDIAKETDWANINHYKEANAELGAPLDSEKRVVFIGDSITENWGILKPEFFSENKFINRGVNICLNHSPLELQKVVTPSKNTCLLKLVLRKPCKTLAFLNAPSHMCGKTCAF